MKSLLISFDILIMSKSQDGLYSALGKINEIVERKEKTAKFSISYLKIVDKN